MTKNFYRNLTEEIVLTSLVTGSVAAWAEFPEMWPIWSSVAGVSGLHLLNRRVIKGRRPRQVFNFEAAWRGIVNDFVEGDPDIQTVKVRLQRGELAPEFRFTHRALPVDVLESEMYRFLKLAIHRQNIAVYKTGLNARGKQIKINWVLSKRYFTQAARPRFFQDEYKACLVILGMTGFLSGRGSGHSGYLKRLSGPGFMLEAIKDRWVLITTPPAPTFFKRVIGR